MSVGESVTGQQSAVVRPVWEMLQRALSPIEYRPRVVAGVEATDHTTRTGTPYVIIRSPAANTYLKLDPREFALLALMDGTRTVKALVVAYYQQHGILALPRIAGLVRLLRKNYFLTDPPLDAYATLLGRLRGFDAGSLLLRAARGFQQSEYGLKAADVVLASWYRVWGWLFFTRPAVLLGAILAVIGPVLFMLELGRGRYDVFRPTGSYLTGLIVMGALQIVTLFIHELGHGLAVKHAGRTVHRAGLMIYYGGPAGYVDTTDVWMAPRRLRMVTSLAGPWTGLVLGGIVAIAATLLPTGSVGALLFTFGFVFLLNNLMNFNPLLELDGYYLLIDLVDRPMLRARALSFARKQFWVKLWRREALTRDERWFALFGLASAAWSVLAVFLALRFWQVRLVPMIREVWESGDLLARLVLFLLGALVAVPLALVVWGLARRLGRWFVARIGWVGVRVAARRHGEALAALRSVPLWSELPEARLMEVARAMRRELIFPGVEVVRQGDRGDRFYVIRRGTFVVLVDGEPVTQLGPGDYFGERAVLNDSPRTATVLATSESIVFSLDRATFQATLAHDLATRARLDDALAYREDVTTMALFRDLSPTELDLLLAKLVPVSAEAGEEIVRQGETGDRFYTIRSGRLEVLRDGQLVRAMGRGEAFGEIALLLDVPRTATVRVVEKADLLALSAADFRDLLAGYCDRAGDLGSLSHQRLEADRLRSGA